MSASILEIPVFEPSASQKAQASVLLQTLLDESTQTEKSPWDIGINVRRLPAFAQVLALESAGRAVLMQQAVQLHQNHKWQSWSKDSMAYYSSYRVETNLLDHLLELPAEHEPFTYIQLLDSYLPSGSQIRYWNAFHFPVEATLSRLHEQVARLGLTPDAAAALRKLATAPAFLATYHTPQLHNALRQIRRLLALDPANASALALSREDGFGQLLADFVDLKPGSDYLTLLAQWQLAAGSKPTAKFSKVVAQCGQSIGPAALEIQLTEWLTFLLNKELDDRSYALTYGGHDYGLDDETYLDELNLPYAKGLVWSVLSLGPISDNVLQLLADLAARCYRKVPGVGPLCLSLGNACVLVLGRMGLVGAGHLSQLRTKTTNQSILKVLTARLTELARELKLTFADIEDLAIPTHGLHQGQRGFELGDYYAEITLAEPTKAETKWYKADGSALKSIPPSLRKNSPAEVKAVQKTATQVQQTLTTQRERLERTYLTDRTWTYARFADCYLHHHLLGALTQGLIWRLTQPDRQPIDALWLHGRWRTIDAQPLPAEPEADTQVQLWHPALSEPTAVLAWRTLLENEHLRQPFKQAFREIYLLTPPEERTGTYSNRMAAHVLKQHQFSALAKHRGWQYRLMGGFDHGSYGASLALPAHHLQAKFWLTEISEDAAITGAGIYQYIATDQVRFSERDGTAVPLTEIPPLVFSEVMRDVDLFVGVASVGNDPAWRDNGGLPAYRTYWESYSFGELGEVAKNRRLALERLVPRLKIGKVSELRDKFLVVRGTRRTYKIHLGSGNILMEPNDQYLCIVPDRSAKTLTSDVFLPFEGDAVLSIILSKAQLLMDDDLITDETINRQIG